MPSLLEVESLTIGFGDAPAVVSDVSFSVQPGDTLALVGESGSGKTLTCRSALRILPDTAQVRSGRVMFSGGDASPPTDLFAISERRMRRIRGNRIAMIFQEPMRSLSPLHRLGNQVSEVLRLHRDIGPGEAKRRVVEQFDRVGFVDPERAWRSYPFEMSGGMRQRAMIAMATVAEPELLIADEPTTALDVTTQAQVLGLINKLKEDTGMAVILGNPKAVLFYLGLLPGFFDLSRVTTWDIVAIVAVSQVVPLAGNLMLAGLVDRLRGLLSSPEALARVNRIAGWLLIAVGVAIAVI